MRVLSLFSGGGLGDYGLELAGMEIAAQVEIDEFCQKILKLRWPDVPKWGDIKLVTGKEVIKRVGPIELISGGFPCQDISTAKSNAQGIEGERSGLWSEMFRIICEVRPRFVLVENVSALLGRGLGVVLRDLAQSGYDAEWDCVPASAVGAPHQRDRIWILAYPKSMGWKKRTDECGGSIDRRTHDKSCNGNKAARNGNKTISNPNGNRLERSEWWLQEIGESIEVVLSGPPQKRRWNDLPTPFFCRSSDGIANRMERLKLLGNGQVVQVVAWIGEQINNFSKNSSYQLSNSN